LIFNGNVFVLMRVYFQYVGKWVAQYKGKAVTSATYAQHSQAPAYDADYTQQKMLEGSFEGKKQHWRPGEHEAAFIEGLRRRRRTFVQEARWVNVPCFRSAASWTVATVVLSGLQLKLKTLNPKTSMHYS
jgi:hypothetical protein